MNKGFGIFVYSLSLWMYKTAIRIVSPWNEKARLWLKGRTDLRLQLARLDQVNTCESLWMHCASLGEFEQGRPILERLRTNYPRIRVLVTFFSPSGYESAKKYGQADDIYYLPIDSKKNAKAFIEACNPSLVIWVKYEYWYYYLSELKRKGIPTLLVSAIFLPGQPFFRWYGGLHRSMLGCFTQLFVQNAESERLVSSIGLNINTSISGDTRFDRVAEIAGQSVDLPLITTFCGQARVIVAGSTWQEDEELLDHYANTHPELRFIIAPHEIDTTHINEVSALFQNSICYSELEEKADPGTNLSREGVPKDRSAPTKKGLHGSNVLIINNMGMLSQLYRYATIAYLGGGFGDGGVHNVLEAAVYGKPVLFGPVFDKYIEAVELVECGGGLVVDSALEVESTFTRLFENQQEYKTRCEASRNYVVGKKGATEKIIRYIQENRLLTN